MLVANGINISTLPSQVFDNLSLTLPHRHMQRSPVTFLHTVIDLDAQHLQQSSTHGQVSLSRRPVQQLVRPQVKRVDFVYVSILEQRVDKREETEVSSNMQSRDVLKLLKLLARHAVDKTSPPALSRRRLQQLKLVLDTHRVNEIGHRFVSIAQLVFQGVVKRRRVHLVVVFGISIAVLGEEFVDIGLELFRLLRIWHLCQCLQEKVVVVQIISCAELLLHVVPVPKSDDAVLLLNLGVASIGREANALS